MQGRREAAAEEIRSPMAGLDLSINSAQSLAASMDNMSLGERCWCSVWILGYICV
jgi:hypothetical protein